MNQATVERAVLPALLRESAPISWSEIALSIQETGSAAAVLDNMVSKHDSLFPDDHSAGRMTAAGADEIRGWEADGIGIHAF